MKFCLFVFIVWSFFFFWLLVGKFACQARMFYTQFVSSLKFSSLYKIKKKKKKKVFCVTSLYIIDVLSLFFVA